MADDGAHTGVAIVGMAATFPGAPDLATYWRNIRGGVDAITDVPADRWDPVYFDPSARAPDRFYCRRGGFLSDASFDAASFGIMPVAAQSAEPDQLLALQAAAAAIADAGGADRLPRERTGVILGRGGYLTPGMARLNSYVRTAEQLVATLRSVVPDLSDERARAVKAAFQAQLGLGSPDASIGLVPNLAASRIANRLDLQGPAYTVDAACASALVAVDQACAALSSGRCDVVLAGGVHLCHDVTFWSVFTQLGALSRRQQIRPFDRNADGLLIGEGVGVVALKRLADAHRDGDRIYAVIRGTGVASDGRESSLMKPRVDGQVLALERAWSASGLDPASVELIEAHGTATAAGDEAELQTLGKFFGADGGAAAIGSVKSMIGHTMPAAGIAGLIKAALAVHHGELPPTLHCDDPHALMTETRFRPVREAAPWESDVRRAGVNAFGFGGINAHIVLDADAAPRASRRATPARESVLLLAAASPEAMLECLDAGTTSAGPCRLALFDPTPERRAKARKIVERGKRFGGRSDIFFAPRGLVDDGGSVCFAFPGIEASFAPRIDDVAAHFGLAVPAGKGATDLERQGTEVNAVGRVLHDALRAIGVAPDHVAGHSIGEWNAMIAAEMVAPADVDGFIGGLAEGSLEVPDVVFAALGCGAERAAELIDEDGPVTISHDNCPHQSIACGPAAAVDELVVELKGAGVLCQRLPFKSGFHSPALRPHLELHREHLGRLNLHAPRLPLWSATLADQYPADLTAAANLVIDHLVEPVRFRQLTERLYAEGVRVFVQVGQSSIASFIGDTLRGQEHAAIQVNVAKRTGLAQLARAAAALFVEGVRVDFAKLPVDIQGKPAKKGIPLRLGVPLVHHTEPPPPLGEGRGGGDAVVASIPQLSIHGSGDPILDEFNASLHAIAAAQHDVVSAWMSRTPPTPTHKVTTRTISVETDPQLIDHTFYRQPTGWPDVSDRYPVVPMTMNLDLMVEHASELHPTGVAVAIENIRAYRWLAVAPSVSVDIDAKVEEPGRVHVRIGDFAQGTVVFADHYPTAPAADTTPLTGEVDTPQTAETLYDDRWMFHGPEYQAITSLGPTARDGIKGTLVTRPARGCLLDNAGQLMGYWIMLNTDRDRLAFPVRIRQVAFYGPPPRDGDTFECTVRVRSLDASRCHADLQLVAGGRVWCGITEWVDQRFDSDDVVWPVLRYPEHNLIADIREDGAYAACTEHWKTAPSRELIARRYLDAAERAAFEEVGLRKKRGWLLGRMAAKDAVRDWLRRRGRASMFPIEVAVRNEASGRPVVSGTFDQDLRVSIAHKDGIAVARVAEGRDVGVDIERIEPRGESFAKIAFSDAERALRPTDDGPADEWLTRVWCAKEAAAKALGTGLEGNPRHFEVREVAGQRLLVGRTGARSSDPPVWIETRRDGEYVVAWSE